MVADGTAKRRQELPWRLVAHQAAVGKPLAHCTPTRHGGRVSADQNDANF